MGDAFGFYIGGKWTNPRDRKRLETINPATGEVLGSFPQATKEDVAAAVKAAKGAFEKWRKTPPPRRGEFLLEAARIFRRRKEELGRLVTMEMGKVLAEGRGDVQEAIDFFEYASGEGRRFMGYTVPSELPNKICFSIRLPVGPVGLITPWNFPIAIPAWKSGAALVAGCTVVLKPSSLTPLCGAKFAEVLDEAGLPPGVFNVLVGPGATAGDALIRHPDIRAISFTGGVDTGREVYKAAAEKMIKAGLELGGKNPILVMDDADLDLLMDGVMFGAFGTAGQRCTATSRLIVHKAVYDELLVRLLKRTEKLKVGNPLDPKTDMGPVASADQERKVLEYVAIGKKEGDKLLIGGKKLRGGAYDRGFFLEPTIFQVKANKRLAMEEIFGPVLSVIKVKDYEEAVAVANSVEYGLSSSIYTNDVRRAFSAMHELEAGITYVNAPTIGAEV
ncbi:MAG TPA: aldehyde dehydrogenase family protein, partial [Thermoplasmata archaeon]|nr:aldehyde dehydrogenase family protein [Thermoplasmata archaeon]